MLDPFTHQPIDSSASNASSLINVTEPNANFNMSDTSTILGLAEGARLEDTPGYILGAALRETVVNTSSSIASLYNYANNTLSNVFTAGRKWFSKNDIQNHIDNVTTQNNIPELKETFQTNDDAGNMDIEELNTTLATNNVASTLAENLTSQPLSEKNTLSDEEISSYHNLLYKKIIESKDEKLLDKIAQQDGIKSTPDADNTIQFYQELFPNPEHQELAEKFHELCSDPILVAKMTSLLEHHYERIMSAIQDAKKENIDKPLLVLFGEEHFSINSYLSEIILAYIGKYELNLDAIHLESFPASSHKKSALTPARMGLKTMLENMLQTVNLTYQPIDLVNCKNFSQGKLIYSIDHEICEKNDFNGLLGDNSATSTEGMMVRDRIMCDQLIKQNPDKDAMAIVGAAHLKGMLRDEELQKHFHVIALSSIDPVEFDPELKSMKEFQFSLEEYFHTYTDSWNTKCLLPNTKGLYLTLNQYSKLIKNIVESQNNATNECKKFESFKGQIPSSLRTNVEIFLALLLALSGLSVYKTARCCVKGVCGSIKGDKATLKTKKAEELNNAAQDNKRSNNRTKMM